MNRVHPRSALGEIADRWQTTHVLKRDVFSTVLRGRFSTAVGSMDAVARHLDEIPFWSRPLARFLLSREKRALEYLAKDGISPRLLLSGESLLVRSWIDGLPLNVAKPYDDVAYFRSAKLALRKLHRRGVCHNDLAKSQNWMQGRDGHAYLIDFQLAVCFARRGRWFRIAAYEDLRHLLKHKRRYAESSLTASERRILARKSIPTRIWMATGKRVYIWVTRGVFRFADSEGSGLRLTQDARSIVTQLKSHPGVRDAVIVAFPDRRTETGLYAFVEALPALSERFLMDYIADKLGFDLLPNQLQVVEALPRRATGEIRTEILQLIALNQVDLIDQLISSDAERSIVASIVHNRRVLGDRIADEVNFSPV